MYEELGADTVPSSGFCNPAISSRSVVFPQPDGPTTATTSPRPTLSSTPSRAVTRRYRRVSFTSERGSFAGASVWVCIAPSAGITPQVRRVSAGVLGAISARVREHP